VQSVAANSVYDNSFMQPQTALPGMGPQPGVFGDPSAYSAKPNMSSLAPEAVPIAEEIGNTAEFSFPPTPGADDVDQASQMSGANASQIGGNTPHSGGLSPGAHSTVTGVTGLLQGAKDFLGEIDQTSTLGGRSHLSSPMRSPHA
jgi:hypothetical protein